MSDIADFLRARYAEQRAAIKAMPCGPWQWVKAEGNMGDYEALCGPDGEVLGAADAESYKAWIEKHDALDDFLAIVQPEALLDDLDAKLATVDLMDRTLQAAEGDSEVDHYGGLGAAEETLYRLAQPFAGHPDHKGEEWTP